MLATLLYNVTSGDPEPKRLKKSYAVAVGLKGTSSTSDIKYGPGQTVALISTKVELVKREVDRRFIISTSTPNTFAKKQVQATMPPTRTGDHTIQELTVQAIPISASARVRAFRANAVHHRSFTSESSPSKMDSPLRRPLRTKSSPARTGSAFNPDRRAGEDSRLKAEQRIAQYKKLEEERQRDRRRDESVRRDDRSHLMEERDQKRAEIYALNRIMRQVQEAKLADYHLLRLSQSRQLEETTSSGHVS
eukprot:GILJ01004692.1.p1 GENE.GILJ01004692.1~~GILJ01004692.1.p1  ORF type:complete len:249 (+),score=23.13 GILJ01004692.1:165-911(+)